MGVDEDAIIVGGGLAGLTCAVHLTEAGVSCQLLEASDDVGGRVRTDEFEGFRLDRGFQVFLTAYPEAAALLDYDQLDLRYFEPGALVWLDGQFRRFSDPWRRPQHLLATAFSPAATLSDKLKVASFRKHTTSGTLQEIYERREQSTIDLLRGRGFSNTIIERFFRPFLGGIFLERDLLTSSRMCEFVFRMFSMGSAALPARGMGEIPRQLASRLPDGVVRTECPVESIDGQTVVLASGERVTGRTLIVATDAPAARRLLDDAYPAPGKGVKNLYFATDEPPIKEPTLVLDGSGDGPINNLCVPSQVSPAYAPTGTSLISVTVLDGQDEDDSLLRQVNSQLKAWFGSAADTWQHLRTYTIPYALPRQEPPALEPVPKPSQVREGVFVCGDHCDTASINGAMASGRRAAEAALLAMGAG